MIIQSNFNQCICYSYFYWFLTLKLFLLKVEIPLRGGWSAYCTLHTELVSPPKNLSCDIWILNPSNELKIYWRTKLGEIPWLASNPESPFPFGFLDYNMFSSCHFSFLLLTLKCSTRPSVSLWKPQLIPHYPTFRRLLKCLQALYVVSLD